MRRPLAPSALTGWPLAAETLEPKKSTKSFGDSKKGRIFAARKYDGGFI